MTSASPVGLGRDGRLFWAARVVAAVGSGISTVALPLLVLQVSGSPALTATVTALQVAPYLLMGLPAGALADRWPRRPVMVTSQLVAALALASVPVVDAGADLHVAHLLGVALVVASAFVWFDAAAFGALPAVVGRDQLVAANSAVWTASTLAAMAGAASAGGLVALVGPAAALGVDAVAYLLGAALLSSIGASFGPERASSPARRRLVAEVRDGLAFLMSEPLVRALTTVGIHNSLVGGAVTGLTVVLAAELASGPEAPAIGTVSAVLVTASGIGAFLGALVLPRVHDRLVTGTVSLLALGAAAVCVVGVGASVSWPLTALALSAWSAAHTLVVLNGITARQLRTPDHLQARVNTTARMVAWGGAPFGAVAAGGLAQLVGTRPTLVLSALVLVAAVRHGRSRGIDALDARSD